MPRGDLPGWKQVWAENFNSAVNAPVPVGRLSGCDHYADTPRAYCSGLSGRWRDALWAYPSGWEDTAKSGADGNGGAPFGGTYEPQKTVSIGKGYDGTGTLKVAMYRPASGGSNVVGTVVPKRCMDLRDGRYSARIKVTKTDPGFKSAWLRYEGSRAEVDYPEVDDYTDSTVAMFSHGRGAEWDVQTNARMTTAHTYTWERRGSTVTVYLDGKRLRSGPTTLTTSPWVWQNESRIIGDHSKPNRGYAKPGARAVLEVTWATCYKAVK
ncbi:glycosyl hydrolase family 16 [Streptomyces venezuelae]|uniref:Glycosyl hydrolase family 16 n=2 Tax=Streptomyces venezuelae TaxID=54571 RepID=A0A5P2CU02_STRVZ|nr:glycosyl hydrolase family 16 [Streptomyces venezuelae]